MNSQTGWGVRVEAHAVLAVRCEGAEHAPAEGGQNSAARAERELNRALLLLVTGKGSVISNLSTITGLTVDGIKSRVKRAAPKVIDWGDSGDDGLADHRYLSKLRSMGQRPESRQFGSQCTNTPRARPDWRSAKDPTPKGGKNKG